MKTVFFSAALFVCNSAMAVAPINGWYSSAFGGYAYIPDNVSITASGLARNNVEYNSGYHAGANLGYQGYPMRYEGEITYIESDLKKLSINNITQTGLTGQTYAVTAMANIYYDFPEIVYSIMPYVGLGLGYGYIDGQLNSTGPAGITRYEGSDSVVAYQAAAGLTYNFSESYALKIGYRYIGTDRVDELGKIFQAHLGTVGITYRFDSNFYK